ncbi:GrpE-domain-containing protein [Ascobolus immersus RN42]|uniref:GrpE protein homolog n=1 Tax=Ascobolus immersus RN42 TaxID=1160509 RepID=A0A3N4IPR3_ASCIM|nr:GrpE-domain-containing protein [Ascobolus immersus RN42]
MFRHAVVSTVARTAASQQLRSLAIPAARIAVTAAVRQSIRTPRFYSSEAAPKEEPKKEEAPKAEAENNASSEIQKQVEELKTQLEAKTKEAADFKDKFLRSVADFRNLQERTAREVKNAKDFAIQKFAKDLVESVDNFERALSMVPAEMRDPAKNKEVADLYDGMKMTEDILLKTLKRHGLEKFDPMGELFDPNKHEATFHVHMPDKKPNEVFHVQQKGFMLNGRVLRAAQVGVAKGEQ